MSNGLRSVISSRLARSGPRGRVAGAAVGLVAMLALAFTPVLSVDAEVDDNLALRREMAAGLVDQARDELTFDLLIPEWLPPGYSLEHIAWFPPSEELGYPDESAVDTWYSAPGRPLLHVWQTDNSELGDDDPVLVGEPLRLADGIVWSTMEGIQGLDTVSATVLSARMRDGTTLSLDSGIAKADLMKVAESLSPGAR